MGLLWRRRRRIEDSPGGIMAVDFLILWVRAPFMKVAGFRDPDAFSWIDLEPRGTKKPSERRNFGNGCRECSG